MLIPHSLRYLLLPLLAGMPIAQESPPESVRGITVSTSGGGQDWGSDAMVETLRAIKAMGGNWVTIHPYGGISDGNGRRGHPEGQVRLWRDFDPDKPPTHLSRPIREAHDLGLKILIKPHLAYWGTRFSWRGEIDFEPKESYERFFASYEKWIVQLAIACREADAFVVGTELDKTLAHEKEWRQIIAKIRAVTDIPLTYAANWPEYQNVPFWDVLDVIGIQAYFPITEQPTSDLAELRRGWQALMKDLSLYSKQQNRNIVFTELGYNRSTQASVRPWEYQTESGREAELIQEACLRTALECIEAEPTVVGSFLWKWFPGERRKPRNFNMQEPRVMKVISESWRGR